MWRVYRDDGTFASPDVARAGEPSGEPHEMPADGFVCAVQYSETGQRQIMKGWDFYCFDRASGQWWGHDDAGIKDRLRRRVEVYAWCEGRSVGERRFNEIMERAHRDPDFPRQRP